MDYTYNPINWGAVAGEECQNFKFNLSYSVNWDQGSCKTGQDSAYHTNMRTWVWLPRLTEKPCLKGGGQIMEDDTDQSSTSRQAQVQV